MILAIYPKNRNPRESISDSHGIWKKRKPWEIDRKIEKRYTN